MSATLQEIAMNQPPFAQHLGLKIVSATAEKVVAELLASPQLINRNGVLHGGAVIGLADNIGGTLAMVNMVEGEITTTMESKTNFFRSVPEGDLVRAEAVFLHKGRRTMVVQTTITRSDGKVAALVTQTQFTVPKAG
ncbi:PaaI family thioesterase [Xinfangfangia sp. CPCC 101601]|uniref:PaaI family thioesterase n=1 Tax=Pseudogemmobacter lacusdianii TaxID=3069608 RepID=A0ABU0VU40_9RHOB|nr:PaaI family thioesterase [Xinfangfangia sp. CPCC 101601]MDQ2065168.1 PaaI family thioesterase [Xinfangfangia sp. CPCC 101601]